MCFSVFFFFCVCYMYFKTHRKFKISVFPLGNESQITISLNMLKLQIVYNYPPKRRWIVVDIYRDGKRRGIYPPLFTDPEGDSCFSYLPNWMDKKKRFFTFFFWNFRETTRHFCLRSQNSEYPRIFRVTRANQNERKLLSTDLVNTNTGSLVASISKNVQNSLTYSA